MSSKGFFINNPKGNTVDLVITFVGRDGVRKKFKTVRPGEACHCDKRQVSVEEMTRPPRLIAQGNGLYVPDTVRPKNMRRLPPIV